MDDFSFSDVPPESVEAIIDVMVYVARSDGKMDSEEIDDLFLIIKFELESAALSSDGDEIVRLIKKSMWRIIGKEEDFLKNLSKRIAENDTFMAMYYAISVAGKTGGFGMDERRALQQIRQALGLTSDEANAMLERYKNQKY